MSLVNIQRPSVADIGHQIGRLSSAFGRPFKANLEGMTEEWHRSLAGRFAREIVAAAVDRCCDTDKKFPTLAAVRDYCFTIERERQPQKPKGLREQYREWELDPYNETTLGAKLSRPCPVCGSCLEATARGYLIVHDDARHTEHRVSYSNQGNPEWCQKSYT